MTIFFDFTRILAWGVIGVSASGFVAHLFLGLNPGNGVEYGRAWRWLRFTSRYYAAASFVSAAWLWASWGVA